MDKFTTNTEYNIVDNAMAAASTITAYTATARFLAPVYNDGGCIIRTGCFAIQITAALKIGSAVRKQCKKLRLGFFANKNQTEDSESK